MTQPDGKVTALHRKNGMKRALKAPFFWPPFSAIAVPLVQILPGQNWKLRIPVMGQTATVPLINGQQIQMGRTDMCDIARELFWRRGGFPDAADRTAFDYLCATAARADTFLDIGSYTGLFSLSAAQINPNIAVHGFEIFPLNHQIFQENISLNGSEAQITPHLLGLSDQTTEIVMPTGTDLTRLPSSFALNWTFEDGQTVPVAPLDTALPELSGHLAIKIDVEGFEASVFAGAQKTFARCDVDILCEVLTSAPEVDRLNGQIQALGLSIYHVTDAGLVPHPTISPSKAGRDWVFTARTADELRADGLTVTR